jgi:hypothetical protein
VGKEAANSPLGLISVYVCICICMCMCMCMYV